MSRRSLSMLLLFATVACRSLSVDQPAEPPAPAPATEPELETLLRYAQALRGMGEADIVSELESLSREPLEEQSDSELLRLALLNVVAQSRYADVSVAEEALRVLLENADGAATPSAFSALAAVLLDFLRTEPLRAPLDLPMEPSQDTTGNEIEALRRVLTEERARRLELQRQLEALRDLERQLSERSAPGDDHEPR